MADAAKAFEISQAIAEAIRDVQEIPSGTLYALVMSYLSLEAYEATIRALVETGLITNTGHLLRWIGEPVVE